MKRPHLGWLLCLLLLFAPVGLWATGGTAESGDQDAHTGESASRLTDERIPLQLDTMPERPKPLLELGAPFLGTGTLHPGYRLPTGAVWQPNLLVFGTFRTALQTLEPDLTAGSEDRITEWASRLDLFANLALSGSERLVVGVRALDQDGRFTSYFLENPDPALDGEFQDELNLDLQTLYFEGDFGEIFPNLDRRDFGSSGIGSTDYGFSVGRQPLLFQEGLLINDSIDGIGITRNTLLPGNSSNFRATFFYGWGNLDTSFGVKRDADLFALLTSTDLRRSTIDFDVAYLSANDASGDLLVAGISGVQRFGSVNSSLRLLGSLATDEETAFSTDGLLLFSELSWTPHHSHDLVYFNTFAAVDTFTAAARGVGPAATGGPGGNGGGPLGRAGISFASPDLGSLGSPLSSRAQDVVGGAFGYQHFFDATRKQLLFELAARVGTDDLVDDAYAATLRYQAAYGQHWVIVVDGFVSHQSSRLADRTPYGGRLELLLKF